MLMFSDVALLYKATYTFNNLLVSNISSYREGFNRVLILPNDISMAVTDKTFDIQYANYLLTDRIFYQYFKNIIIPLYNGMNLMLLVSRSEIMDIYTESIQKFILERYGYKSFIPNEELDLDFIDPAIGSFSLQGIYNLDNDMIRYEKLCKYYGE